jgi:multiple sugar transport system substrate-binding protein
MSGRTHEARKPGGRLALLVAGAVVAALLTAGATAAAPTGASASCTKITFWAWVPGIDRAVKAFNKSHPTICVTLSDVGAGSPEYTKLTQALKAGKGAPDVAEVEYDELPSFVLTKDVLDLTPYGVNKVKSTFVPWAWKQVSQGSAVYALPGDAGPMALYYNQKMFAKYHVTVPKTWAEFSAAALKLHKANPKVYLSNFSPTDLQLMMALMAQAGAWPFVYTGGSKVTINWTGPKQTAFAAYWQKLIDAHAVNATSDVSTAQFTAMDRGIDIAWTSSAWWPSYFAPSVKRSSGDWRAAPLPQWKAGQNIAANWGGSAYPVFKQSQHPKEATEFAIWLNATMDSWNITKTAPSLLFPTFKPLLDSASFKNFTVSVSGPSHPYQVFGAAASKAPIVQWPPFMTEALADSATAFAKVINGKQTLQEAFKDFQDTLVSYAKRQGFDVSTGGS